MKTFKEIYTLIVESLILEAMSLKDIWEKYYSNIGVHLDSFIIVNRIDPTSTPTKKGKYLDWLIRKGLLYNPQRFWEDSSKITEDLALFDKNYRHINKQITQIKNPAELSQIVADFRKKQDAGEIDLSRSEMKSQITKIFEDFQWLILTPKTEDAAKYYGKNTRWCTAAEKNNYFYFYNDLGPLYILINKDKPSEKYQFHFQSKQFMDSEDIAINDYSIFPEYILDKLVELSNKNNMIVDFICRFNLDLNKKYAKLYSKEIKSYNLGIELLLAVNDQKLQRVKEAINNGAYIHIDDDKPLRNAVRDNNLEIVKVLIENGADIHAMNESALFISIKRGYMPMLKYLIDNGADIHANNEKALDDAAYSGNLEVVRYLVERGADIHANNDYVLKSYAPYEIKEYFKSIIDKEKK